MGFATFPFYVDNPTSVPLDAVLELADLALHPLAELDDDVAERRGRLHPAVGPQGEVAQRALEGHRDAAVRRGRRPFDEL